MTTLTRSLVATVHYDKAIDCDRNLDDHEVLTYTFSSLIDWNHCPQGILIVQRFQITIVLLSLLALPVFSQNDPVTPARAKRGREADQTPGAPVKRHEPRAAFPLFNVENLDPQFAAVPTEDADEEEHREARRELTFDADTLAQVEEGRQNALEEIQRVLLNNAMRAFVLRGANPCGAAIGELGFSGF